MQTRKTIETRRPMFEGLEQRQFFSAAPMGMLPPPPWADGSMPMHPPVMFDAGAVMNRAAAMQATESAVDTTAVVSASPAPGAFNGYPASASNNVSSASSTMSLVNRAVDGEVISADDVRATGFANAPHTVQSATPTSDANAVAIVAPARVSATAAPTLPDAQITRPVSVFSSEPIRSDAGVSGVSAITTAVRSAEQEIACVVRLAWADLAYTDAAGTIGRLASEAGQAISRHAADAELAAAMVMGVAGAAWWVRENQKESAVETADAKRSMVEVF